MNSSKKVWLWAAALWVMAQAAFAAVKAWVLGTMPAGVTLAPTWAFAAFALFYGLWTAITSGIADISGCLEELEDEP